MGHRLARPIRLGIPQTRHFGRVPGRGFSFNLSARAANITPVASQIGRPGDVGNGLNDSNAAATGIADTSAAFGAIHLGRI
jgi:hypothetical protein